MDRDTPRTAPKLPMNYAQLVARSVVFRAAAQRLKQHAATPVQASIRITGSQNVADAHARSA